MAQPVDVEPVLDAATAIVLDDGFESANLRSNRGRGAASLRRSCSSSSTRPASCSSSLLNREYAGIFRMIVDHMDRDPLGGLLSHIYRHTLGRRPRAPARPRSLPDRPDRAQLDHARGIRLRLHAAAGRASRVHRHDEGGRDGAPRHRLGLALGGHHRRGRRRRADRTARGAGHVANGLAVILERAADTDALDTTPGKRAFLRYGSGLAGKDDDPRSS